MKKIHKKSVDITRSIRKELKLMREVEHLSWRINQIKYMSITYSFRCDMRILSTSLERPRITDPWSSSPLTVHVAVWRTCWPTKICTWTTCLSPPSCPIYLREWSTCTIRRLYPMAIYGRATALSTPVGCAKSRTLDCTSWKLAKKSPTSKYISFCPVLLIFCLPPFGLLLVPNYYI